MQSVQAAGGGRRQLCTRRLDQTHHPTEQGMKMMLETYCDASSSSAAWLMLAVAGSRLLWTSPVLSKSLEHESLGLALWSEQLRTVRQALDDTDDAATAAPARRGERVKELASRVAGRRTEAERKEDRLCALPQQTAGHKLLVDHREAKLTVSS